MPQVINTNISALNAQRNLEQTTGGLSVSLQRLSSGLRINSAKDDLLTKLKKIASTPYMRTRYLKAARSGINITSIYRHINLAPDDVYRISHSWNDKQQSPQP